MRLLSHLIRGGGECGARVFKGRGTVPLPPVASADDEIFWGCAVGCDRVCYPLVQLCVCRRETARRRSLRFRLRSRSTSERDPRARGVTSSAAGSSGDPRGANPTSGVIACNGMMVHEPGRHVAAIWNFGSLSCTVGWSTKVHMQLRMHEQGRDQGSSVRRFRSSWKRKKKQKKKESCMLVFEEN